MIFWILCACAIGMVLAQDVRPGLSVYHYGWYNAIAAGFAVLAWLQLRRRTTATLIAMAGCAVCLIAGIAAGLMGPDTQTVIGAPGSSVRSDDAGGSFVFPLDAGPVVLRRGQSNVEVGSRRRYTGGFVMWLVPRTVVYVEAADPHGGHLTITQPTNASFLSPVLLMQQSTSIAGMDVRFDTFSIPAIRRSVRAVLFTQQQAEQLRSNPPIVGKPAVLFALSDMQDRALPHGIGIVASGDAKSIAGVLLRPSVQTYPAVAVASAPYLPAIVLGMVLFAAGALLDLRNPFRSRT